MDSKDNPAHTASDNALQRQRGDLLFAVAVFLLALFLLSQLGEQTRWFNRVPLTLQPRFWPAVILVCLALFSGLYLVSGLIARRKPQTIDKTLLPVDELTLWARPLEYAVYFVVYAALIPWLGYLLATVLFMPLLGIRVGYRSQKSLMLLAACAVLIVVVFKTGLQIKMPPGAVYELLPPTVRNFLIRNF